MLNWGTFFELEDPDALWDWMENKIVEQADLLCPIRTFRMGAKREPWLTNEAMEAIRDKDKLIKKAKRTRKAGDWDAARIARNQVGRDLEQLKAEFLKREQEEHKGDPKKFWKNIAGIFPGKRGKSGRIWLKENESNVEVESERTADFINKYFTNIGPDLAAKINSEWRYYGEMLQESIRDFSTNLEEVKVLCKDINIMKSSGIDILSSRLCKDAFMVLGLQLVHLFNCSLYSGKFPAKWKVAKIIPLYKGGDREQVSNYRPVSLLPLPGKMLEKIVHSRITKFWDNNQFLSYEQGGFRKGHSTVATIANLTDDLFHQINQGNTTLAAFVDLRKAFDTVNTKILLDKLRFGGIKGKVLEWCTNYLSNRFQCTLANGVKSGMLPVTCGVPQGSVLGPLFFLVYVNDIQNAVDHCGIKLYADDTVLYQSGVNVEDARVKLQASMNKFKGWCDENVLTVNASKTKIMAFATRSKVKKCKGVDVRIGNEKLKLVPSYKYLGLTLDSTLNYNCHIAQVIKLVCHKLTLLAKLKKYLRRENALLIYKSMILPYIDYADVILCEANKKDLDKLQKLQNKCLKICLEKNRRFNTGKSHRLAKVPFLNDRRAAHVRNFMYKRKDNRALLNNREIRTRAHDAPVFNVPIPRCEAVKRSVCFHGSNEWNSLPAETRNIQEFEAFKRKQKLVMMIPINAVR